MKIHICDRPEPLREGMNVAAKCGALVEKAAAAFMFDFQAMGKPVDIPQRGMCKWCCNVIEEKGFSADSVYVYGIVSERDKALLITNRDI